MHSHEADNEGALPPEIDPVEFADDDEAETSPSRTDGGHPAVIAATDWTVETIVSQLTQSNILLTPRFQRRDAWTISRKSKFIESLVLGLPIPQIVLAVQRDARGKYIVLDGKQRLLTLLQFTGQATGKHNAFALRDLVYREDLNGKTYSDLANDPLLRDVRDAFNNETIRSVVLRAWPDEEYLHTVFLRLNTGSVPLSPQELRQALNPGPFADFADDFTADSVQIRYLLGIREPDFRMRDVELLVRHLAFSYRLGHYAGDLRRFLDSTSKLFTEHWPNYSERLVARAREFEEAIRIGREVFGDDGFARKWTGRRYQNRLNRALLDVQAYYFCNPKIRKLALQRREAVTAAFKEMCTKDYEFLESIETTTKSLGATATRFQRWAYKLSEAAQIGIPEPIVDNGRVVLPDAPQL